MCADAAIEHAFPDLKLGYADLLRVTDNIPTIEHRQVEVPTPIGDTTFVDYDLAPLLLRLWDAGLWTVYSCQGFHTSTDEYRHLNCTAYILFRGTDTAHVFADSAARFIGHTITVSRPPRDGFSIARFHADDVQFLSEAWEPT
jgi:hypothetical protein